MRRRGCQLALKEEVEEARHDAANWTRMIVIPKPALNYSVEFACRWIALGRTRSALPVWGYIWQKQCLTAAAKISCRSSARTGQRSNDHPK